MLFITTLPDFLRNRLADESSRYRYGVYKRKRRALGKRADCCAVPVVGVSTLLANAARVTDWEGLICSFFDARRNEVYAALIRKQASSLDRLTEDLVGDPERIADTVRSFTGGAPVLFVGDGTKLYGDLLSRWFGAFSSNSGESYPSVASAVARLSEDRFQRKDVDFLGSLAPVYLRRSETKLKATSV